ncbi:MAG: FapA family protein [Lachnospiraceae bacterium]|nr:FapA family protein [Lachnospiraceae bacterium]
MGAKNGYFKLVGGDDVGKVIIYPPVDGGKPVDRVELGNYLLKHEIEYDITAIEKAIAEKTEKTVPLLSPVSYTIDEEVYLFVSKDSMKVYARFYPPTEKGGQMSFDALEREMKIVHLRAPLKKEAYDRFCKERLYCTTYLVAVGEDMEEGTDGWIEYFFNTDSSGKPTVKEDGSVDFFELNKYATCKAGGRLALLHLEKQGKVGADVYGKKILPPKVKAFKLIPGKNVRLSEDGMELYAESDGHVKLVKDKVEVSGVLEIPSIDTSSGNVLNYQGNMLIKGNVSTGFKVSATGDIEIQGVLESADVEAGGQITVVKGINAKERSSVKAGTNVISKYVENANIEAGGYVHADCIINSHVVAVDSITVEGKKAQVAGGSIRATNYVSVGIAGSPMEIQTSIEVGTSPEKKARLDEILKRQAELRKGIEQIKPIMDAVKKKIMAKEAIPKELKERAVVMSKQFKDSEVELGELKTEQAALEAEIAESKDCYVEVKKTAYPGTKITISGTTVILKNKYQYCKFYLQDGDVRSKPLV